MISYAKKRPKKRWGEDNIRRERLVERKIDREIQRERERERER